MIEFNLWLVIYGWGVVYSFGYSLSAWMYSSAKVSFWAVIGVSFTSWFMPVWLIILWAARLFRRWRSHRAWVKQYNTKYRKTR